MREALSGLPPEKLAGLLPVTSPIDVLVVGDDKKPARKNTKRSERWKALPYGPTSVWDAETASLTIRNLGEDAAIEARSLARVGLHADALAASNNWVVERQAHNFGQASVG